VELNYFLRGKEATEDLCTSGCHLQKKNNKCHLPAIFSFTPSLSPKNMGEVSGKGEIKFPRLFIVDEIFSSSMHFLFAEGFCQ